MTALLVIIYISFISLGLPDSMLGAAWPVMHESLNLPVSFAGAISMVVSFGTVVSSLLSARLVRRFGAGLVTAVSVLMTAAALLLFSVTRSFPVLLLLAVPLGLGGGSVDAALNNFIALHYKARHMSWLHCFWGVGCMTGPVIMSYFLARGGDWPAGYRVVGLIQSVLVVGLFLTLPLWKKAAVSDDLNSAEEQTILPIKALLKLPGAKQSLASFYVYCSIEATIMLWGATFLVKARGVNAETAAQWMSLNILGITAGRLLSGFLTMKFSSRRMIKMGQCTIVLGAVCLAVLRGGVWPAVGLFLVGFGCAPIYPSLIHETPRNFGAAHSQQIIGIQMACAYVGTTLMPPLFGLVFSGVSYALLPYAAAVLGAASFLLIRSLCARVDAAKAHA